MTDGPFIVIRAHTTESQKRGYRWTCTVCEVSGMNQFDRWTDWVRRRNPDLHPWLRCLKAVEVHLFRSHRDTAPNACRWCGVEQHDHFRRSVDGVGLHTWTEPTDRQRKARMLARRASRKATTP